LTGCELSSVGVLIPHFTAELGDQVADRLGAGKAMTRTMGDLEKTRLQASECAFFEPSNETYGLSQNLHVRYVGTHTAFSSLASVPQLTFFVSYQRGGSYRGS